MLTGQVTRSYGDLVEKARGERNLTQLEAATELGVSPRTLQGWENEGVVPQAPQRRRILEWLKEAA